MNDEINRIDVTEIAVAGEGKCEGGYHPDLPLDRWPLLAWMPGHPRHGNKIFTEDGAASVEDVALLVSEIPDYQSLAERFRTSAAHVSQAVDYAVTAGFIDKPPK